MYICMYVGHIVGGELSDLDWTDMRRREGGREEVEEEGEGWGVRSLQTISLK